MKYYNTANLSKWTLNFKKSSLEDLFHKQNRTKDFFFFHMMVLATLLWTLISVALDGVSKYLIILIVVLSVSFFLVRIPNLRFCQIYIFILQLIACVLIPYNNISQDQPYWRIYLNGAATILWAFVEYQSFLLECISIVISITVPIITLSMKKEYIAVLVLFIFLLIISRYIHNRGQRLLFLSLQSFEQWEEAIEKTVPSFFIVSRFEFRTHQMYLHDQNKNFKKMMDNKFKHLKKGTEDNKLYIDFLKSCEIESNLSAGSAISPSNNNNNSNNSNSNLTGNNPISQINKNMNSFTEYPVSIPGNTFSISRKVSIANSCANIKRPRSSTPSSNHNINNQQSGGNNNNYANTNANTNINTNNQTIHNSQTSSFFDFMLKKHNQIHQEFEKNKAAKAAEEKFTSQKALQKAKSLLSGNSNNIDQTGIEKNNSNNNCFEHGSSLTREESLKIVFKNDQCVQWFKVKIVPLLLQEPLLAISLQDITQNEEEKKAKRVEQEHLLSSLQIIAKVRKHLEFLYSNLPLLKSSHQVNQSVAFPLHIIRSTAALDKTSIPYSPFSLSTLLRELCTTFDNIQGIKVKMVAPEENSDHQINNNSTNYLNVANFLNLNNYPSKQDLKIVKLCESQDDSQGECKGCESGCQECCMLHNNYNISDLHNNFYINNSSDIHKNNNNTNNFNELNSKEEQIEVNTEFYDEEGYEDFDGTSGAQENTEEQLRHIQANMLKYNMLSIDQIISAQTSPYGSSLESVKNTHQTIQNPRDNSGEKHRRNDAEVSSCQDLGNPKNHQILLRSSSSQVPPRKLPPKNHQNQHIFNIPKSASQDNLNKNFHQVRKVQRRSTYCKNAMNSGRKLNTSPMQSPNEKKRNSVYEKNAKSPHSSFSPNGDKFTGMGGEQGQRNQFQKKQPEVFIFPKPTKKIGECQTQQLQQGQQQLQGQQQQLQGQMIRGQAISSLAENPDEDSCGSELAPINQGINENNNTSTKQGVVSLISAEEDQLLQHQQIQVHLMCQQQQQQQQFQKSTPAGMFSPSSSTGQILEEESQPFDSMSAHHKSRNGSLNQYQRQGQQQQQQRQSQLSCHNFPQAYYDMNNLLQVSSTQLAASENLINPASNNNPDLVKRNTFNFSPQQQTFLSHLGSPQEQQQLQGKLQQQLQFQQQLIQQNDVVLISNYRLILQALSGLITTFQDNKIEILAKILHRKLYSSIRFTLKMTSPLQPTSTPLVTTNNPQGNISSTNNPNPPINPHSNTANPQLLGSFEPHSAHEWNNNNNNNNITTLRNALVSPRLLILPQPQTSRQNPTLLSPQAVISQQTTPNLPSQSQLPSAVTTTFIQQLQLPPLPFQVHPSPRQSRISQVTLAPLPSSRQPPGSSRRPPQQSTFQQPINRITQIPKSVSVVSRSSSMATEEDFMRNLYGLNYKMSKQLCVRIWRSIKNIASIMGPESIEISQNCVQIEFFLDMNVISSQGSKDLAKKQQQLNTVIEGIQNTVIKPSRNSLFSQHFNSNNAGIFNGNTQNNINNNVGLINSPQQSPSGSAQNIPTAINLHFHNNSNQNIHVSNFISTNELLSNNQLNNNSNANYSAQHFGEFQNLIRNNSGNNLTLNSPKNFQTQNESKQPFFSSSQSSFSNQESAFNSFTKHNRLSQKKIPPSLSLQAGFNDPFLLKTKITRLSEEPEQTYPPQQREPQNSSTHLSLMSLQSQQDEGVKDIQQVKDFVNQPTKFENV